MAKSIPIALKELRERAGYTLKSMAIAIGYKGASSYQRYELDERDGFKMPTLQRLAGALIGRGKPPITAEDLIPLFGREMPFSTARQKAIVYDLLGLAVPDELKEDVGVLPAATVKMPVVGSVQASFWMPSAPSLDVPMERLAIPFEPEYPPDQQYALKVVGPSMNKVVLDGQYVICLRYGGGRRRLTHNRIVHVQRDRRGEVEWTLKRIRYDDYGEASFWPESTDPAFQEAIPLNVDGDTEIHVVGIAVGVYTKLIS